MVEGSTALVLGDSIGNCVGIGSWCIGLVCCSLVCSLRFPLHSFHYFLLVMDLLRLLSFLVVTVASFLIVGDFLVLIVIVGGGFTHQHLHSFLAVFTSSLFISVIDGSVYQRYLRCWIYYCSPPAVAVVASFFVSGGGGFVFICCQC